MLAAIVPDEFHSCGIPMTPIIGASGADGFIHRAFAIKSEPRTKMFTTYILRSDIDGRHYIGSTTDINRRLTDHNKGRSKYTKNRGPFKLIYKEEYETLSEARKREFYLKSLKSRDAIENLIKHQASVV